MITSSESRQKIVLGVTGGIAAYKSAEIVRRLQNNQCQIKVVMTESAKQFIGPLTFQALTGNPVYDSLFSSDTDAMEHIELARWADKILIAPASANFIAKLANGFADDLLSTLCLAAEIPIHVAPAMNQAMWRNPATQDNIQLLIARKHYILGPDEGVQACGETGPGRLLEPEKIVDLLFNTNGLLTGKTIVITAGPTREAIDPVRFISNHSSGKMGYALAQQAALAGATVKLISGPTALKPPAGCNFISVESADDMYKAVMQNIPSSDIFISCAAVADYRPVTIATKKIKKQQNSITLEMQKNPDILADVCKLPSKPYCIGFAAETNDLLDNARQKLINKKADLIIANPVGKSTNGTSLGFNAEDNQAFILSIDQTIDLGTHSKSQLAKLLIKHIVESYEKKHSS